MRGKGLLLASRLLLELHEKRPLLLLECVTWIGPWSHGPESPSCSLK